MWLMPHAEPSYTQPTMHWQLRGKESVVRVHAPSAKSHILKCAALPIQPITKRRLCSMSIWKLWWWISRPCSTGGWVTEIQECHIRYIKRGHSFPKAVTHVLEEPTTKRLFAAVAGIKNRKKAENHFSLLYFSIGWIVILTTPILSPTSAGVKSA